MKANEIINQVVAEIIAEIERGVLPWNKPWNAGNGGSFGPLPALPLRVTGESYRGINILALWSAARRNGYSCRYWMTYKQAEALNGQVRKGEKATGIIYADHVRKEEQNEAGETVDKSFSFLKAYAVFNAEQIENLPERFYLKPPAPPVIADTPEQIEEPKVIEIPGKAWLDAVPAVLRHGGNRAFFSPQLDFVQMPEAEAFKSPTSYATTLIHELVHWSGHESRLNREFGARFGDDRYAMEELVAELGSAFGAANLGFTPAIREDHAPYLAHWLKILKASPQVLVSAAAKASAAIDYLDKFSTSAAEMEMAA